MSKASTQKNIKRTVLAKIKGQNLYDPRVFLSPARIDIAAKTIFARAYLEGNKSSWPEYIYREHIRAFNNFHEDNPKKDTYADFRDSFIRTIKGVKDSNSWKSKEPVTYDSRGLINGAHRVAASIVLADKINTKRSVKTWNSTYDHQFFRTNRGDISAIDEDVLDYITIEYTSLKTSNIFVAVIFPAAEGHREEAFSRLSSLGEIVNMKTFKYDEFVGKEVIKQLYFNSHNDEWNYGLDFESATYKADLCFAGKGDLQVYVIEANLDETTRIKEKQYLRSLWKKDKHSIHITDTIEEANRVVRMFFNANSRDFLKLNRAQEFASQNMYDLFDRYIKLVPKGFIDRENVAIEGSAVLDLYGVRQGRDIDYISRDDSINFAGSGIEKHSVEENSYHRVSVDDLLTNPKYFFYYKGYKFLTLKTIGKYKQNRFKVTKDPKDKNDTSLIDDMLTKQKITNKRDQYPRVSVIVPVYNTPLEYLSPALDSISSQVYPKLEVIIVDDGSGDSIKKFLDNYIKNAGNDHQKWSVVHQKNTGLSGARNTGYALATGEYVQFLDADDYFDERLISSAVHRALQTDADVVVENFTIKDYDGGTESVIMSQDILPDIQTFKLKDLDEGKIGKIPYNVWSKLFKKSFLDKNKITHDVTLRRAEDVLFSYKSLISAHKIAFLKFPYIVYRENLPQSNTKNNDSHPTDSVVSWTKLYEFLKKKKAYSFYRDDFLAASTGSIYWHMKRMNTETGVQRLAAAADEFLQKIGCPDTNFAKRRIKLALEDYPTYEEIQKLESLIDSKNQNIALLQDIISNQESTIKNLDKPGLKTASRKLAGAVKRRVKRDLGRIISNKN